jgi:hypothetical protein
MSLGGMRESETVNFVRQHISNAIDGLPWEEMHV